MGRTIYLWQLLVAVFVVGFFLILLLFAVYSPEKIPQSAIKVIIPFNERFDYLKIR